MADTYSLAVGGSTVGANARKTAANYGMGTPVLTFIKVAAVNSGSAVDFSAETANSNLHKAVASLSGFAEIYWVDGGTAGFIAAVVANTANSGSAATPSLADGSWGAAEAAILAAVAADTSCTITALALASNGLTIA
jgi:hypothetical protein